MDVAIDLIRVLGGGFFVASGASKFGHPDHFWSAVMGYRLTSARQGRLVAAALPPFEFVVGMLFATGYLTVFSGSVMIVLLLFFTTAIVSSRVRNLENDCGCTGSGPQKVSPWLIVRNVILIGFVVIGMLSPTTIGVGTVVACVLGAIFLVAMGASRYLEIGTLLGNASDGTAAS